MAHGRCGRCVLIQNKHSRWWGAALTPQRRCRTFSTRKSEGVMYAGIKAHRPSVIDLDLRARVNFEVELWPVCQWCGF